MESERQEAESLKYCAQRVMRLSSGRYALFARYDGTELPLLQIGTIEELIPLIVVPVNAPYARPAAAPAVFLDLGGITI